MISTYNDAQYVEKKIKELVQQSIFSAVEFLFIETASPQGERTLIEPYTKKYSNIKLITKEERYSLYEAWNIGWESSSADLICYTNMDDALHPNCLELARDKMNACPEIDVCTVMIARQTKDSPGHHDSFEKKRLKKLKIERTPGPFSMWRKPLSEKMGMFSKEFRINGDNEFYSRAASHNVQVGIVPKVLYLFTMGNQNSLSSMKGEMAEEHDYAAEKKIKLTWHPKLQQSIWILRKSFPFFPFIFLLKK